MHNNKRKKVEFGWLKKKRHFKIEVPFTTQ